MTDHDLVNRIEALEMWRTHQTDLLDELINGHETTTREAPQVSSRTIDPEELVAWVQRHVTAVIARPVRGELRWCPRWWEHAEAVFRFEALRRAWQELAPEPGTAMSIWIRDHLDPCLRELLSPLGPFADCSQSERSYTLSDHIPLATLRTAPYQSG